MDKLFHFCSRPGAFIHMIEDHAVSYRKEETTSEHNLELCYLLCDKYDPECD